MALPSSYTQAYGKLGEFFGKIRDGQAPDQFSTQLLKYLGYKSNNHRAFIPVLKSLGFLTSDGKPHLDILTTEITLSLSRLWAKQ